MKTQSLSVSLLSVALLLGATGAQANHPDDENVLIRARVISATPAYQSINEPRRECWTETSGYDDRGYEPRGYRNNTGASIIGAIAGGLLGSTVGKGNGRVAAAAVGAATGAVVGGQWNNGDRHARYPEQVERCRTTNHVRHVMNGYDVRYRVEGRVFNTRLPYDPGKWVTLNANLTVAEDQRPDRFYSSRNQWDDRNPWNGDDRNPRNDY